jgi:SAM-dependent methyltransferase
MVRLARELNHDRPNCVFFQRDRPLLEQVESGSVDFVYSAFVLQHLSSEREALGYVRELVRVVRPGGTIVFQLPPRLPLLRRLQPRRRLFHGLRSLGVGEGWLYRTGRLHPIRLIGIDPEDVRAAVEAAGAQVVRTEAVDPASPLAGTRYFVKPTA